MDFIWWYVPFTSKDLATASETVFSKVVSEYADESIQDVIGFLCSLVL